MNILPTAASVRFPTRGSGSALALVVAAIAAVAVITPATPLAAELEPTEMAKERCSDQLTYQISLEAGGRNPDSGLDRGPADVRPQSKSVLSVTGNAWYRRDAYDRGRPYTYECTFDLRNGAVDANYHWSGPFEGGDEHHWPGGGTEVRTPNGRVVFSGGVINVNSGKALDVSAGSTKDYADVGQFTFRNLPNQLWDVIDAGRGRFVFVSQKSDKALDVAGSNDRDRANVQQLRYNGSDAQLWRIERVGGGAFQIVNVGDGRCLDVKASSKENSANVQTFRCVGSPNQAWRLGQ